MIELLKKYRALQSERLQLIGILDRWKGAMDRQDKVLDPTGNRQQIRMKNIDRIKEIESELGQAEEFIEGFADSDKRLLLRLRYVEGLTWRAVARKMFLSERGVYYLHRDICDEMDSAS